MLRHYVFLKYRDGTSAGHVTAFCERLLALRATIGGIEHLEIGRDELHGTEHAPLGEQGNGEEAGEVQPGQDGLRLGGLDRRGRQHRRHVVLVDVGHDDIEMLQPQVVERQRPSGRALRERSNPERGGQSRRQNRVSHRCLHVAPLAVADVTRRSEAT